MDIKEEIKHLAKRLESGEKVSDGEIESFITQARDYLMDTSKIVDLSNVKNIDQINTPLYDATYVASGYVQHNNIKYFGITTCSCGARDDSCLPCESYNGSFVKTSMFAISTEGNSIRFSMDKDKTK